MMDSIKGASIALIASLVLATLSAVLFRFPIPFAGIAGPFGDLEIPAEGLEEVVRVVFFAWLFYGAFGGFVLVTVMGGIAGYISGRKYAGSAIKNRMISFWSAVAGGIPVLSISTLDYFIGPW